MWIDNDWLLPYSEDELQLAKDLIPFMAILQENTQKVWPIMDYHKLNEQVDVYMASTDICT